MPPWPEAKEAGSRAKQTVAFIRSQLGRTEQGMFGLCGDALQRAQRTGNEQEHGDPPQNGSSGGRTKPAEIRRRYSSRRDNSRMKWREIANWNGSTISTSFCNFAPFHA